jgi:release factor glutamine methyltransferase
MHMRLFIPPGVFRPRSDSWMLADAVADRTRPGATALDPFTGSGVLAVAAAMEGATATAIDVSRRAVLSARLNARLNGVAVEVLRATDLSPLGERRFDLIAANPPYLPSADRRTRGAARAWAAGPDGRRFVDRLCADAPSRLVPGGRLLLVHSSVCGEGATLSALEAGGLEASVIARETGPIGPLMASGLAELSNGNGPAPHREELLIFEAVRPAKR